MNFLEAVKYYLNEKVDPQRKEGGYKAMATRLSRDLGKDIPLRKVKSYMKKMDKGNTVKDIKRSASKKGITSPKSYEYATKYKIMKAHFSK